MLEKLAPEFRFASLTDIETEWLKEHQFEALVLDIDNTLLARDCTRIPADHLFGCRTFAVQASIWSWFPITGAPESQSYRHS